MSFYQVSSTKLRESEEQLLTLLNRFQIQKEELTSQEVALAAMWQGEANTNFHTAFTRDIGQLEAFAELINNYARVMGTIADRYDSAESRNLGIATNRTY